MKLKAVVLRDFRAYRGEVIVPVGQLTALIGRNDIGKSSVLEAAGIFLGGDGLKADASDLCVYASGNQFRIGCVFTDHPAELVLDASSRTNLRDEYLLNADGDLEVHRLYERQGDKVKEVGVVGVTMHPTAPGTDDLLLLKNADLKRRAQELGVDTAAVDLRINAQLRRAIWAHSADPALARTELPLNKEDAKAIWDKLSESLPLFALFKADRPSMDGDAEVQDPMALAVRQALLEVQTELDAVKTAVESRAMDVARRTLEKLKEMSPELAQTLEPHFRTEPKWDSVFKLALSGEDAIPLNKRGSGFRRLVLLSFFQAEAERQRQVGGDRSIVYAIEEPEASQHPDNQRMLVEALKNLAEAPGCQVLLTTHVPALAGLLPIASVRHILRSSDRTTTIEHGGSEVLAHVADNLGVLPDARVAVFLCVEGPHDVKCIKQLARALREEDGSIPDLDSDRRIAVIPLGGNTLRDWVDEQYLRHTNLPEVHIYDRGTDTPPKYQSACDAVNARGGRFRAFLTLRPELENYLHADAIKEGLGVHVTLTAGCDVPDVVARAVYESAPDAGTPWSQLPAETVRHKHSQAKRRLNRDASRFMRPDRLDTAAKSELREWFAAVASCL